MRNVILLAAAISWHKGLNTWTTQEHEICTYSPDLEEKLREKVSLSSLNRQRYSTRCSQNSLLPTFSALSVSSDECLYLILLPLLCFLLYTADSQSNMSHEELLHCTFSSMQNNHTTKVQQRQDSQTLWFHCYLVLFSFVHWVASRAAYSPSRHSRTHLERHTF